MSSLSKIWESVKYLISEDFSVIPVRDKDSDNRAAKTTFSSWKQFQNRRASESELWSMMEEKKTEAVSIVCGAVSGNLEVIDIDSKHKPGISILLFKEIKSLRPDLYDKIRVHKTPSGGYHILYRIADHLPVGNIKLAGRYKSEEEIQIEKDSGKQNPQKTVNFLETRGEGGYVLAPPSLGYSIHIDKPTPLISWIDRCELISICESFNEVIKPAKIFTSTKSTSNIYNESPWDDFNNRGDISAILQGLGWQEHKHKTADRIYYVRPGSKSGSVHASFSVSQRYFWAFTTNSDLDSEKSYKPVDLLCQFSFQGDKSATYKWLVDNGYGKVKARFEEQIVKNAAINNGSLPANFSDKAIQKFEDLKESMNENMPFGIFWESNEDKDDKYVISREDLYNVSHDLGFRLFSQQLVRINGGVISLQSDNDYINTLKNYIWEEEADVYKYICNTLESFMQKSGKFTMSRLKDVDKSVIMNDGRDYAYKFFLNGFITVTCQNVKFQPYSEITGLVWEHKVQNRDWNPEKKESVFKEFVFNAVDLSDYTKRVIGYLAHDFKQESSGYIIVLTEKVPDPRDGGGSGKNVFGNMMRFTNTLKTVPGSQVKFDENFLQPWNGQRLYFLADIPKKIDWLFLKEMATGTGIHKKLYKDQVDVPSEDMPKICLNTNYSFEESDGGLARRIRQLEFTPFYTIRGGVDEVHGKMFPGDFSDDDWTGYDHFIVECLQKLFCSNGKLEKVELSTDGWIKKFQMQYGESTYMFILDNIEDWVFRGFVPNKDFSDQYITFANSIDIPSKFRISAKQMANALTDYCKKNEIEVDVSCQKKINSINARGKFFGKDAIISEKVTDTW